MMKPMIKLKFYLFYILRNTLTCFEVTPGALFWGSNAGILHANYILLFLVPCPFPYDLKGESEDYFHLTIRTLSIFKKNF